MGMIFTILLATATQLQDVIQPDTIESTSSNPGLVIASAILITIVIGAVILHTYPKKS
jgi:hypothetical protein